MADQPFPTESLGAVVKRALDARKAAGGGSSPKRAFYKFAAKYAPGLALLLNERGFPVAIAQTLAPDGEKVRFRQIDETGAVTGITGEATVSRDAKRLCPSTVQWARHAVVLRG